MNFSHPDGCKICSGSLIEMLTQTEQDGVTIGVRHCPELKPAKDAPVKPPAKSATATEERCELRHMLPGMDNKTLQNGGIQCELKAGHDGDCKIIFEQPTTITTLGIDPMGERSPKILNEIKKPKKGKPA